MEVDAKVEQQLLFFIHSFQNVLGSKLNVRSGFSHIDIGNLIYLIKWVGIESLSEILTYHDAISVAFTEFKLVMEKHLSIWDKSLFDGFRECVLRPNLSSAFGLVPELVGEEGEGDDSGTDFGDRLPAGAHAMFVDKVFSIDALRRSLQWAVRPSRRVTRRTAGAEYGNSLGDVELELSLRFTQRTTADDVIRRYEYLLKVHLSNLIDGILEHEWGKRFVGRLRLYGHQESFADELTLYACALQCSLRQAAIRSLSVSSWILDDCTFKDPLEWFPRSMFNFRTRVEYGSALCHECPTSGSASWKELCRSFQPFVSEDVINHNK